MRRARRSTAAPSAGHPIRIQRISKTSIVFARCIRVVACAVSTYQELTCLYLQVEDPLRRRQRRRLRHRHDGVHSVAP